MERLGLNTVALVGLGPSQSNFREELITQDRTEPIADEIWCINAAAFGLRCDRVIWMDDLVVESRRNPYCAQDLDRMGYPVLTSVAHKDLVKNSIAYPIKEAVDLSLSLFNKPYLNNSVAYAICYAMLGGVERLKMYGCDFTYPDWGFAESGRACVEAWLLAFLWRHPTVKDSSIQVAGRTSLFDTVQPWQLYGYDFPPDMTTDQGEKLTWIPWKISVLKKRAEELVKDGIGKNAQEIELTLKAVQRLEAEMNR